MSLVGLLDSLRSVEAYRRLMEAGARGAPTQATVMDPAKPYVIAALWRDARRPVVVVCPHPDQARRMVDELQAYLGDDAPVYHFAESEVLPYERLSIEAGTVHERLRALGALHAWASESVRTSRASARTDSEANAGAGRTSLDSGLRRNDELTGSDEAGVGGGRTSLDSGLRRNDELTGNDEADGGAGRTSLDSGLRRNDELTRNDEAGGGAGRTSLDSGFHRNDGKAHAESAHTSRTPTRRESATSARTDSASELPPLVVTSVTGLMQKTLGPELFRELAHTIRVGQRLAVEPLLQQWARMGYAVGQVVDAPGTAARRGGILDVYGPGDAQPARIDLWGDEVETIRAFDVGSQRSLERMEAVQVLPAAEILPALTDAEQVDALVRGLDFSNCKTSERDRVNDDLAELMSGLSMDNASLYAGFLLRHTLLDHLAAMGNAEGGHPSSGLRAGSGPPLRGAGVGADGGALVRTEVRAHSRAPLRGADAGAPVLIVDEPAEVEEAGRHLEETAEKLRLAKEERGELPRHFPAGMLPWREAEAVLRGYAARLALTRFHHVGDDAVTLSFGSPPSYHSALDKLTDSLKGGRSAPVVIATQHSRRMEEVLREADVGVRETRSLEALDTDVVDVVHTSLPGGWVLRAGEDDDRPLVTLLTDNEVFGTAKRRVTRPRRHAQRLRAVSADELQPGQYVVHVDHGIGKFVETISRSAGGTEGDTDAREYLVLEYAEGDRLYVPMEHLDRISPYIGGDEAAPSPTRLGTQEWTRAVSRAKESTKKLAVDLLALYAQREMAEGFPHGSDTPWQREVEDAFPFVETPDQQSAIDEVKNDMEQAKPMDRLVCGDVGYGKTEVALRAAVKAVMSGRQVALLVPTTVLAQQHYMNFAERLSPFPVTVEVLSRFRSHKEQDEIIAKLKSGDIDIVIGTHRLVQKDVGFKELGLVIIDEEHRFGVGHKERLKELRQEVDVLTLTATPIPRTLHMALAGIRDISTIETPPEERLPIRTYLAEASDDLIREAVLRELDRGGQVYFLHNRVKTIDMMADKIRELVPEARVVVGHGQMPEETLSAVMEEFSDGEADVLVCTTIIESGLDIPAVNTLIVDHADRLGLAQLYQLRGRIGRRSQRAYAYLLVERGRRITELAHKRLQTIVAATELGAGFRIAMKDLEIRGAGNLLGGEQSGQIQAVGFELYTRLLAEAVAELRASTGHGPAVAAEGLDPVLDLELPASIPEELVPHMPTRMAMYSRIAKARTLEDVDDLPQEFYDRFGHQLPDEVHYLLYAARVKILARWARVESVTKRDDRVVLKLVDEAGGARAVLQQALGHNVTVGNQQIHLPVKGDIPWGQALLEVLERLEAFQKHAAELVSA